ncbi:L-2-hydroxyglutarate oxidase [Botrimarina hoheduenensis]|uniref:L-2-hydroxyglutarate oxidase LhgO n=1 Tax=Botrimarina hoheduenensis TaxID=2528000 RepID=A0A5C5WAZ8_9BACT|nr:L-2-hydroxyglutarate oxidase [Botrimarina hoheduenensis]TWT47687.1 L-2-hydroxyglutarate oxidase LhgO [Botrimarina hoheduenensis]
MIRGEVIVIGGGIVGLATAYAFVQRFPDRRAIVLEKENRIALHQTGRNSGVLHSGIYYKPGSLKALICREGKRALETFCQTHSIPFERCGKVIVAVDEQELPALDRILERGRANGIECERISPERLAEIEPHARGIAAIHVPETGIVDYTAVCQQLVKLIEAQGGSVHTGARATAIRQSAVEVVIETPVGVFAAPRAVNCAGLHSDRVARLGGANPAARIVPFRGEYFKLAPAARGLCRNLIYPTPDPSFPFLGVHFTRMIDGSVECGPNAVFSLAREGYSKAAVNLRDVADSLSYPGFLKLAARHWRMGAGEVWRSVSKGAFVRALQRLVPEITAAALEPAPPGIRAQAVLANGQMVDDFLFEKAGCVVNVLNAPSPAATASLSIGKAIVDRLAI